MFNPMNLNGKRIFVTGASSGIGQAISVYLSRLGAQVFLVGRNAERLEETLKMLDGSGHRSECFDLTKVDEIPRWMKTIASEFGTFHGLVHSAGMQITLPIRATKMSSFDEVMQVNVSSAYALTKGFRQRGVKADTSSVIYLSSVMGLVGQAGNSAYCCSKGALISLCKSLALELAGEGVRVNCIAPGVVETTMAKRLMDKLTNDQFRGIESMHPLGLGSPDDVSAAAAFLLADTGRWITGTCLTVDGGYTAH